MPRTWRWPSVLDGYAQCFLGLHAPQPYPYDGVVERIITTICGSSAVWAADNHLKNRCLVQIEVG
jgi:hypothetical protein